MRYGNVVFDVRTASVRSLETSAEAAMERHLGKAFMTVVRPIEKDGARILRMEDGVVFSAYLPTPKGPVFMTLLQKTFGKEQTTRTWQTLEKVVSR